MKRRIMLLAPAALAGCASLLPKQKYIPRISWPLNPPPPAILPANAAGKIVLLRDLNAGPGLSDQAVETLEPDGSLHNSYYNQWSAPPAMAAAAALGNWLLASGAFGAVTSPGSRLTPDLIIEGELTELLSDLRARRARAVLTLVVIGSQRGYTRPLAQQRIIGAAPLTSDDYAAQAAAQNAALADALRQAVALVTRFA